MFYEYVNTISRMCYTYGRMKISINGQFVEHITLQGNEPEFAHGFGVFETMRTYNGNIFQLDDHLERLRDSAEEMGIDIVPDNTTIARWANSHLANQEDTTIKIIAAIHSLYILSSPLQVNPAIYTGVGMKLMTLERQDPSVKSLSYAHEHKAHAAAVAEGYHDALLMNGRSEVLEGAHSNFFYVKDEVMYTARNSVLQGITRSVVLDIAKPEYDVKLGKITLDAVLHAHECFLTQSGAGIVPVTTIDQRQVHTGEVGPVTTHLMELFADYTS